MLAVRSSCYVSETNAMVVPITCQLDTCDTWLCSQLPVGHLVITTLNQLVSTSPSSFNILGRRGGGC